MSLINKSVRICLPNLFHQSAVCIFILFNSNFVISQNSSISELRQELNDSKNKRYYDLRDTVYVNALNKLAFAERFYSSDNLYDYSTKAIAHSKRIKYYEGNVHALLNLGRYYTNKGNPNKGILKFQEALKLADSIRNKSLLIETQGKIGDANASKGNYTNALNGYLKALELADDTKNHRMISILNGNIADLYIAQSDYEQAMYHFLKVKKADAVIGDEINIAQTAINMASLYGKMGQYDHAIFNANSSIKVFEKHKLIDWIAHAYEIKGNLYLYQDKLEWALYWFDQSELIHEHLEDDRQRIDLFHGIAEAHLGLKKDSIAELYTHKALELSKTINSATGKRKSAEILYKINKHRANHEIALGYHETYHSLSDSIINNAGENSLLLLKTKTTYEEQKAALIVSNAEALANQKNYITGFLGILLALILIIFLVKRSEKIQKNLNAKLKNKQAALEKHEAELMEINQTKDKLFSIIGHDLRAPIGAFQGLIQMFRKGEVNQKEFLSFIPKLGSDIDHISFTLNNLLSWGHSQMNGSTTRPENTSLTGIIEENMNLLAEIANSKSIKIINEVPEDFMTWSDSNQITIVLRNLISNSLKFTPENGMVTLRAKELKDYYEIAVIDTGVGMDKETRAKIFSKNDNVTTYGTNNEKGTGLGLMLCKEMVEKNNGEIWVDSAPKIGTTFYFTLPKAKKVAIQRAG